MTTPGLPLAGIRVIELGQVLAGPFAGAVFADLGAEVIKVERPEGGDDGRRVGAAFRYGDSMTFHEFNRNKKSVTIDLKSPAGVAQLEALVATADILVHNLRPGSADELGIGGARLTQRHPRLIYCEMGAFGHQGPMRLTPGYEPIMQAFAGLSSITGEPDGPPVRMGASVCDMGTGMWTVIGALAALERRRVTGKGGIVNTSLFETALMWAGQKICAYVNEGKPVVRDASGHPGMTPYQAFDAADGPFLICAGNDRLFVKLADVLGHPEWPRDARFATNRERLKHKPALLPMITAVLKTAPRQHWIARLSEAGVPCAPINSIPDVMAEPQTAAVGLLQTPPGEDFILPGLPISFDGARPPLRNAAPRLGADNAALLGREAADD
jgi:crotonobetainyl-CoA:carnitine CoA-transferase CaiB-like acyl-CoA transferase